MIPDYIRAVGDLQQLMQTLANCESLTKDQAEIFSNSQKTLVNFLPWVKSQIEGEIKVEIPDKWKNEEFKLAWKNWKNFKKEQFNFCYKPICERETIEDLFTLSQEDYLTAIQIIKRSIKNGWSGLYSIQNVKVNNLKSDFHDPDFN